MQELDKAQEIGVPGAQRDGVLAEFETQRAAWDIVMPPVQPLVLDFGLGHFKDTGLVEFWICNESDAGYCGKFLFLFDGQTCPMHRHRHKTETFFISKGVVDVCMDGAVQRLRAGDTLLIPPWVPHSMTGVGPALILEISTPCLVEDNYFENPHIPIGGNYGGGALPANDAGME